MQFITTNYCGLMIYNLWLFFSSSLLCSNIVSKELKDFVPSHCFPIWTLSCTGRRECTALISDQDVHFGKQTVLCSHKFGNSGFQSLALRVTVC